MLSYHRINCLSTALNKKIHKKEHLREEKETNQSAAVLPEPDAA
jgi:hypothetical protein